MHIYEEEEETCCRVRLTYIVPQKCICWPVFCIVSLKLENLYHKFVPDVDIIQVENVCRVRCVCAFCYVLHYPIALALGDFYQQKVCAVLVRM